MIAPTHVASSDDVDIVQQRAWRQLWRWLLDVPAAPRDYSDQQEQADAASDQAGPGSR